MKKKYLFLFIFVCMSLGYSVLNSNLTINGKSNISKNNWDIHFDNISVIDGSVEAVKIPTVTDKTTVDFEVALNLPGDFYEFTVDVVNNGTIDAMIESITKEPELTEAQQKYLNYIIEYQNKEQVSTNQLVKSGEFVRLKVRVELRKDIDPSDLPDVGDVLYLSFTVNYQQADANGILVTDNGILDVIKVMSGDGTKKGNEICISDECFYVMYSDEETITMLSKYNLYVGGYYNSESKVWTAYGEEATGIQDSNMIGYISGEKIREGIIKFTNTYYWSSDTYPVYVYNSNSLLYPYIENYKNYLITLGVTPRDARVISYEELEELGCSAGGHSCNNAPKWVYSTPYWTGSAYSSGAVWGVTKGADFGIYPASNEDSSGIRPVIVISKKIL